MMNRYIRITGHNSANYKICKLTQQIAHSNSYHLLSIHNIIPYVHWKVSDLLADVNPKGVKYEHKWDLSFVVYKQDRIVGFLVAYVRDISDMHPVKSIYIHRLAIAPNHQGNGIGHHLLKIALRSYAQTFPNVLTYTVQTNDETANARVIKFYQTVGFQRFLPVYYPEKLDILLQLERSDVITGNFLDTEVVPSRRENSLLISPLLVSGKH